MMIKKTLYAISIVVLLGGYLLANDVLRIKDKQTIINADEITGKKEFYSGRAQENFLRLKRDKPYGLPKAALSADMVDTITILALRIGFVYEAADNPTTTGRGNFDIRDSATFVNDEGHWLDPAPHNKHYFESHLRSLSHYWSVVSKGKIHIEYEVWPVGADNDTNYYLLGHAMDYYGAQPPNFGLGEFFHNAITKAYDIDGDNFEFRDTRGNKKAIILFHAGADRQTDLSFSATPTPNDLFTGFVTFDLANALVLDNDTIVEGIIMPETMAQDNRITVMNAVMAHEFGHQLGLIDLYNTGSSPFLSQMGDFALMDNNGLNTAAYIDEYGTGAFGTVPIFPCAWSRAFLGIDEVAEYREGTSIELAAVKMETENIKIVKIPISATEYYLLENRRSDIDGNLDGLRVDSTSNVVLWPVKVQEILDGDSVILVKTPVPEYDVYLPGSGAGIAIWHVDEAVAAMDYYPFDIHDNNFQANTLQWDRNRRFVRLVEADGLIDFGGNYSRGYGFAEDLFYRGNNTTFGSYTNPPSKANSGGYTHIKVENISNAEMVMTFDIVKEKMADNFPRRMSIPNDPDLSPVAADLDGEGNKEIIAVSGNKILAVTSGGRDFMDPYDSLPDNDMILSGININTDINTFRPTDTQYASMPLFAQIPLGNISTRPVVTKILDTTLVFVGASNGWIYSYLPFTDVTTSPAKYRAKLHSLRSLQGSVDVNSIIVDEENNIIYGFYSDGNILAAPYDSIASFVQPTFARMPMIVGVCEYGDGMAILYDRNDYSILYQARFAPFVDLNSSFFADSVVIDRTDFKRSPVASDFNRDGIDEIIIVSENGQVLAYSFTAGGMVAYSELNLQTGDTVASDPAIADMNDDGFPELYIPGINKIYGYDRRGTIVSDFPLDIDFNRPGQVIIGGPIISDINGDNIADVAIIGLDSILNKRTIPAFYIMFPDTINYPDSVIVVDTVLDYAYYNYYSNLYAITPGYGILPGYPIPAGMLGMRQVTDTVNGIGTPLHVQNGSGGLLITFGGDGWMDAWDCGWSDIKAGWPMSGGYADGSGYMPLDSLGQEKTLAELLPESSFYNYPNPASGEKTTIRFYVNQPARVTISMFDATGDMVEEKSADVADGNRNVEIDWYLSGVASGIYHCRIEAAPVAGGDTEVAFTTIAVVR
ncbi:MAG: FG-GAP-like repeat-containing protein [Candidatus Zixiibacteriota bacterium]